MIRRPTISKRTDTVFPDTTLCRSGQELDCLGGARNCPAVAEDLGIIHSRMTLLSHGGGHVTRFLERVPQFLHVMRAGNRNDRRPSADRKSTRLHSSH